MPNRTSAAPAESKDVVTAKELVEKTKDLAHKIAQAKAAAKTSVKPKQSVEEQPEREIKSSSMKDRFANLAQRISNLVVSATGETDGHLTAEGKIMQEFNSQFEHLQDDAPVCDICGSITVRNGTCYKCFNCGNSMGCS